MIKKYSMTIHLLRSFQKYSLLSLCMVGIPCFLQGADVNSGLFQLDLSVNFISNQTEKISDPICYAITNRKTVEVELEWKESKGDDKQSKIITKRVRIDPYLFGRNLSGKVILRGNISSEKVLSEINVKSDNAESEAKEKDVNKEDGGSNLSILRGRSQPKVAQEPKAPEKKKVESTAPDDKKASILTGIFHSVYKGNANSDDAVVITKISGFVVIEDSNFVPEKDQKEYFSKDIADTICSVE